MRIPTVYAVLAQHQDVMSEEQKEKAKEVAIEDVYCCSPEEQMELEAGKVKTVMQRVSLEVEEEVKRSNPP